MRIRLLICIALMMPVIGFSQSYDEYLSHALKGYEAYKSSALSEYEAYRAAANAEYADFMSKPWRKEESHQPLQAPKKVPDIPPVVLPELDDIEIPEDSPIAVDINLPKLEDKPIFVPPIKYIPKPEEKSISFVFYGTNGRVRFDIGKKAVLRGFDEKAVSQFWNELSCGVYDNIVADCLAIRDERNLCDWASLKMMEKLAEAIYKSHNERAVFCAWLLSQCGYRIRLGRENENIHLLVGTSTALLRKPYWKMNDGFFSLLEDKPISSLYIMDADFPQTSFVRMRMSGRNSFEACSLSPRGLHSKKYTAASANVSCDKNMLAFLEDMPMPAISGTNHADYLMYARTSLSAAAASGIYKALSTQVKGKKEMEAANILLNFVQTAFEYKTDTEVWGKERVFFPEETLYYPYCDCEDRAILFCHLVQKLMGLDVAFVSYPGHLAAAVNFKENVSGDHFLVSGKKYVVCDPTYINAPVGRTMPGMDNKTAEVFLMTKY